VHAQQATQSYFNWPASAYDYQNSNNDPQTDINVRNVDGLRLRWGFQIPVNPYSIPGAPPALGIETQTLVVKGIAYVATPYNRIIALNTQTGARVWDFQIDMTKFIGEKWWAGAYVISGISLYNETLYVMSSDTTVYALYVYRRAFESGQYGYGAALAFFLIVIGVAVALLGWRFFDMERLLQRPRIEVH